ncbi:MAG: 50S ribosomal protein L23 [Candidatus Dojkabacteria bacterium]|nr:MAG: 50S ribosomal protein L23 [Candidatus Dojkabacteria bacterium]
MIVIKKPIITEKSLSLYKDQNKVTFEVALNANFYQAKRALENLYGVKVVKGWTHTRLGKPVRNRLTGKVSRKSSSKIMIFELKKGDKIDIFNQ